MATKIWTPGEIGKKRHNKAKDAVESLTKFLNDELPKRFTRDRITRGTFINEEWAPSESYSFRHITITKEIRNRVEQSFVNAGWRVSRRWGEWTFYPPQNMEFPDLL